MTETVKSEPRRWCPACRGSVFEDRCSRCERRFPDVAGLADFRLDSDRYLDLASERAKAERLSRIAETTDLEGVARAYYAMTHDVDPPRCQRFLAHILGAEARGDAFLSRLTEHGPTLEVGCGTGGLLVAAAKRGWQVEGVDIASRWLVVARRRLDDHGLTVPLTAASADRLPWPDGAFGTVLADSLIEHCDDPLPALREWHRVLRPGGRLILWSPNRFSVAVDPHVRLWGLGFLPRSWAIVYARLRRGGAWLPRTISARRIKDLARSAGFKDVSVEPLTISREWAATRPARERRVIAVSEPLHRFAATRAILRTFGPIWALEARR